MLQFLHCAKYLILRIKMTCYQKLELQISKKIYQAKKLVTLEMCRIFILFDNRYLDKVCNGVEKRNFSSSNFLKCNMTLKLLLLKLKLMLSQAFHF